MTEHDRDEDLSRRYRELAREEPPRALDDAILAAARREVRARPAPLVAPSGRRRWYVPVAAAAVIVLSAVVTLHVQREQPDEELAAPQPTQAPAKRKDVAPAVVAPAEIREERVAPQARDFDALRAEAKLKRQAASAPRPEATQRAAKPQLAAPAPQGVAPVPSFPAEAGGAIQQGAAKEPKEAAETRAFTPDPAPIATAPPAPPAAAPAMKPAPRLADSAASAASPAAEQSRQLGGLRDGMRHQYRANREDQAEPPEKMLDRIAALRREGRGKEADDLYAEFKRRFPDYRIPDAMREQVLPR